VIAHPAPALDIVAEDLDDDVCLYRRDIDEVLVLNQTAGDVWRLADGTLSVSAIAAGLAGVYAVDQARAEIEVRRVVDDLAERGYLVDRPAPGPS
jgi:hypothetical protein